MYYFVSEDLFEKLPTACFGAVAVRGLDNHTRIPALQAMLAENIAICEQILSGHNVKEHPDILPYREAFRALGLNPNKYLCSIEALLTRIAKKKGFPSINPAVDLGNLISIHYRLPIGAHDLETIEDGLEVRASGAGDTFVPFGGESVETPDAGEIVYAAAHQVRTRRWTWRQSELGKITPDTSAILYPIDGFTDLNRGKVEDAMELFCKLLREHFGCEAVCGMVDRENPRFTFFEQ